MEERKGLVLRAARCVLLPAWLGVLVYHSPRFPGRGLGAVFGIARAGLMLISLAYPLVKRIPYLHDQITPHVSLQTILTVHICLLGGFWAAPCNHPSRPQVRQWTWHFAQNIHAACRRDWLCQAVSEDICCSRDHRQTLTSRDGNRPSRQRVECA